MTKPKVLISDALSPAAVQIFRGSRRRGRLPAQPRQGQGQARRDHRQLRRPRDPLGDQGDREDPREGDQAQGDRPRRHRRRQRRDSRRHGQGHHRDEHAVRQFDHDRRARHHPDAGAGARDSAGRRFDPGRQVGEEPLHGRRDHRQGARRRRLRQHRLDRRRPRARPAHEGDRVRSVPVAGARQGYRRREGRARRPAQARRLHHAAHAAHREDQEHHRRGRDRQDEEGRAPDQLRPRRPRRRAGAWSTP